MKRMCDRCGHKWEVYNPLDYERLCPECRKKKKYWIGLRPKKGASLSGFTEGALGIILFLSVIAVIIISMNNTYNKTEDPTFGFSTNDTLAKYIDYQNKLQNATTTGVAQTNLFGLGLDTIWAMVQIGVTTTWTMLTGGWISNAVGLLQLGDSGKALALILRLLYIMAVGFIVIKLITKVKP